MADYFETARSYVEAKAAGASDADARKLALTTFCPPSAASRALEAKADNLAVTWSPTGYYTGDEMLRMVSAIGELTRATENAYDVQSKRYASSYTTKAWEEYTSWIKRANDYMALAQQARGTDKLIDSPGFKRWVIGTLRAAYALMREVEIASCQEPFWVGVQRFFVAAYDTVVDVAKTIGRTVAKAGQAVLKAGDALFAAWPFIKWGALGFGALAVIVFAYNKLAVIGESGRKPIEWSRIRERTFPKRKQIAGARRR